MHGFDAEVQHLGDVRHGAAGSEHPQHLILAIGQRIVRRAALRNPGARTSHLAAMDLAPTIADVLHRLHELRGRAVLRQV